MHQQTLISVNTGGFVCVILDWIFMENDMTATLKRIALTLARSKDFPNGSSQIGYDFIAPLDSNGHIDLPAWKKHRRRMQRPAFFSRRGRQDRIAGAQGGQHRAWAVGV